MRDDRHPVRNQHVLEMYQLGDLVRRIMCPDMRQKRQHTFILLFIIIIYIKWMRIETDRNRIHPTSHRLLIDYDQRSTPNRQTMSKWRRMKLSTCDGGEFLGQYSPCPISQNTQGCVPPESSERAPEPLPPCVCCVRFFLEWWWHDSVRLWKRHTFTSCWQTLLSSSCPEI